MRHFRCSRRLRLAVLLAVAAPSPLLSQVVGTRADTIARGRAIFVATCRSCHSVAPPPQAAPPMSLIARRYIAVAGSRAAAANRIAEWLMGPTAEKSILAKAEVARFGVMPHQPLADAGRFAVAAYVVMLADSAPGTRRRRSR